MAQIANTPSRRTSRLPFGSRTDIGCVREHNEDSLIVTPPLFVVADGMGGHAAGEIASEIAVQTIAELAPSHPDGEALAEAVNLANEEIIKAADEGRGRMGMGTTCTAAMLEGERLIVAQVGDSRAYLLHEGRLQQITRDHSLMADMIEAGHLTPEEARIHPNRSVITRALGSTANAAPDVYELNVETGDRLLLCSDGLSSMIWDDEIEQIMLTSPDPQRCASNLVSAALDAGGYDNVTVIVVDVEGFAEARRIQSNRKTLAWAVGVVALLVMLLCAAAYGFNTWINTCAYLTETNGYVSIYRGVPGSIAGIPFSTQEEVTDISTADLAPNLAEKLRSEGVTTDSMDSAKALAEEYRAQAERNKAAKKGTMPGSGSTQSSNAASSTEQASAQKSGGAS